MSATGFIALLFLIAFSPPGLARKVPPRFSRLSQTGLYHDIGRKEIDPRNLSYLPQYPLWSDGASKRRWVSLPKGTVIRTDGGAAVADLDHWVFPVGTKFWKELSFEGRRVETRFSEKLADGSWRFSTYLWNEDESDAELAPLDGVAEYAETGLGTTHDIPGEAQCLRCHRRGGDWVLGFDFLQLSDDRDPLAPHAEPLTEGMITLKGLVARNRLAPVPEPLREGKFRIAARNEVERAALGYLYANCGNCHNPFGRARNTGFRANYPVGTPALAAAPAFLSTLNLPTLKYLIPGQQRSFRIKARDPENSALLFRMRATAEKDRMPPIGRKVPDLEAVALIERWISSL